ncbi:hypothetical protein [Streptomyces sp. NBC_00687]|uniref:hypothetical protein n=1 Tax=Streptomyces sp. NBC_00687 TaxID=2975807 RepID=UPI0022513772|nr:hypothetical protein [Streptomyces sp. NBC_00687]MCX4912789.1 hypothetical protein [Streptomyces sp. NBC_00687]
MTDIPKSRDAKHPFWRQLLTPFYRTRASKAKRRTAATKDNVGRIKAGRAAAANVKELRRRGILK